MNYFDNIVAELQRLGITYDVIEQINDDEYTYQLIGEHDALQEFGRQAFGQYIELTHV